MHRQSDEVRLTGAAAIAECERFFMGDAKVNHSLNAIARRLHDLSIPYAIAGGMALVAHGYMRATEDVDVLVTKDGLGAVHKALEGLGYVAPFTGSKNLKDTATNTRIEFLVAGQFPGDGKPKPIAFPDPANASVEIDGVRYLNLPTLVELKLASGMTGGVPRMKDFADVIALIQLLKLPLAFSAQLNPYVREKFEELWNGIQSTPPGPHE